MEEGIKICFAKWIFLSKPRQVVIFGGTFGGIYKKLGLNNVNIQSI